MRDIHIGKRGSVAASEEQPDTFKYDLNKKLRVHQRLQIQLLPWNILRVMRHKVGLGPYLCRSTGHVDDDVQISALDAFCEMDGWTKESLHRRSVGMVSRRRCQRSREK